MESLSIKKMVVEDLPEVMAIENVSFSTPFTENLFRMEIHLDVAHLYVARYQETTDKGPGQIVGYIDFWMLGPEIHLITIAVHPDWRGRGIGNSFMELLLQKGRENSVEKISLDVRPSNEAARALYRRYGFEQVGVRKRYYQDTGEDALLFSLSLT